MDPHENLLTQSTCRERVDRWWQGELSSYIPSWCPAVACSTASAILGRPVHSGSLSLHYAEAVAASQGQSAYEEFGQAVLEAQVDLSRTLGWEFVGVPWRLYEKPTEHIDEWTFVYETDNRKYVRRYDPHAGTFGIVQDSLHLTVEDVPDAAARMMHEWRENPTVEGNEYFTQLSNLISMAGDEFEIIGQAGGFTIPLNEAWMMAIHLYPDAVQEYLDFRLERGLCEVEQLRNLGVRFVEGGGDFADNTGPTYSPSIFREWMIPRFRTVVDRCNEYKMIYIFRSDGDLWPVLDDIFHTAGCHGYGEIDDRAGMHMNELAQQYPDKVFFGNLSNDLLKSGSEENVTLATKTVLQDARNVKLVIGPSNVILHDTPAENVLAMQEFVNSHNLSTMKEL